MLTNLSDMLQSTLIQKFGITADAFDWDTSLVQLQPRFMILATLIDFEQAINQQLESQVQIIGKINTIIHTPNDVLKIIEEAVSQ